MTTAVLRNGAGWNSGLTIGPKTEFTLAQTDQLSQHLIVNRRWHDLALLSLGLDSFLRAEDLLQLRVRDVCRPQGLIRDYIGRKTRKTGRTVYPVLTPRTKASLARWIEVSGKTSNHALFTRHKPKDASPITRPHYAELVKDWADWLGLPPEDYSTHSIRRTKPVHLFWEADQRGHGERILVLLAKLLGHKSIDVTMDYLGITQRRATELTLSCQMVAEIPEGF